MEHTDKQLKEATQIAYLSLLEKAENNMEATGEPGPYSVGDLISSCIDLDSAYKACEAYGLFRDKVTLHDLVSHSDLTDEDKERISLFTDEMFSWKIVDINDFNQENGLYSCIIETEPDTAIVAFRGSENMKKYANLVHDWAKADFGLFNSEETSQQKAVEAYLEDLSKLSVLDKYNSIDVTGHSLGGNLASHFTVASAKDGREAIFNKINKTVNFDGPGVSDEYLKAHEAEIAKAAPKITHYSWSAVGEVLFSLPGEKKEFLAINDDLHKDGLLDRLKYKTLLRHDTRSLLFDEDGNAKRGKQDLFSMTMSGLSKFADKTIPAELSNDVFAVISSVFKKFTYEKEDGSIGFKLPFMKVKEEHKKNPFCLKCGEVLKNAFENIKNKLHLFGRGESEKKSGLEDTFSGIQGDNDVRASSVNSLINTLGKDMGKEEAAYAR